MSQIMFVEDSGVIALDRRVPVVVVSVDVNGTAVIELDNGERRMWSADKLLPAECYLCKGMQGEMKIIPYGGAARLRCVHSGECK